MPVEILAPISVGELFDKISILEIKLERLNDQAKRANITHELTLLRQIATTSGIELTAELTAVVQRLKAINTELWDAEDQIRSCERRGVFDEDFQKFARSIYHLNDRRAAAKRELNVLTSSSVVEEKSYAPYDARAGL